MAVTSSFYTADELQDLGFKSIGNDVRVSRKASFYGSDQMELGSHVRIDDFCYLSGRFVIGNYVHIAVGCVLYGSTEGIVFEDFSGLAPRVNIHADSDDYSGNSLTNPMTGAEFKTIRRGRVTLRRHVIIGSGSVVLPGVELGEGSSVGAMSLVVSSTPPWTINAGIPAKALKARSQRILDLEKQFLAQQADSEG